MDFSKPRIMGILNATPDSFSDGGDFNDADRALGRIREMIREGADIIDLGGQSTGPGSPAVSAEAELSRVKPIIDRIKGDGLRQDIHPGRPEVLFSIDTYYASVARYALKNGFSMVNDVTALRGDPEMTRLLLEFQPWVVLMYSKDPTARTTAERVEYEDVMASVKTFLTERISRLAEAGFPEEKILIDPGMGMFVSAEPRYSFEIIDRLKELRHLGYPILVGASRKSFLGGSLKDRDPASVEWSMKAIRNGASVVRIHAVTAMRKAMSSAGF